MNCSNVRPPPSFSVYNNLTVVICYTLVFVLAFVGNSGMFLILCRNQFAKRRRVHSLLLHMTIAHLLVTLIYIPKEIVHNITVAWLGGDILCRLCKFFDVFGVALSAMILVCLSLDRFYSILFPLYVINAKRSVQRMLTVAWIVAFASSLPQIYIFRTATHPCFPEFSQCVSGDVVQAFSPKITFWFSVYNILQVYFFPLLVIIICYGSILISISLKSNSIKGGKPPSSKGHHHHGGARSPMIRNGKSLGCTPQMAGTPATTPTKSLLVERCKNGAMVVKPTSGSGHHQYRSNSATPQGGGGHHGTDSDSGLRRNAAGSDSYEKAKNRTLKMTIVLVLAFLLCWTPYTIAMFVHFMKASSGQRPISPLLSKFLYAFAVFNSAISPYLYGYFSFNVVDECRRLSHFFSRVTTSRGTCGSPDESAISVRSRGPGLSVTSTTESIFVGGRMRRAAQSEYNRCRTNPRRSTGGQNSPPVANGSANSGGGLTAGKSAVRFHTPPVASHHGHYAGGRPRPQHQHTLDIDNWARPPSRGSIRGMRDSRSASSLDQSSAVSQDGSTEQEGLRQDELLLPPLSSNGSNHR